MNKKTLFTVVAVSILSGGLVVASNAYAQTSSQTQDPMNTLVTKIADKFNVDKAEVQKVFDENHKEMQAKHEEKYVARLDQLVKDGTITAEQKTLLLNKHKELLSQMESNKDKFKDLTPEERKAQMDKHRTEIEAWAKENGVDAKYLMMKMGHGKGGPGMQDKLVEQESK